MKWIALEQKNGLMNIVRIETIDEFAALNTLGFQGRGLIAKMRDGTTRAVVFPPADSDSALLLAALNGPVGEVPYK